jgi:hypothetical protein
LHLATDADRIIAAALTDSGSSRRVTFFSELPAQQGTPKLYRLECASARKHAALGEVDSIGAKGTASR